VNIFALSYDVDQAAIWHIDKHIVKMPLETAQMLCSNLNKLGETTPYKTAHANHPCTLWAGKTKENFIWLCELGFSLCEEYTFRYLRRHKCQDVIEFCYKNKSLLPSGSLTPFAQAMPEEYKDADPIIAYRNYYKGAKINIASWKLREAPEWMPEKKLIEIS
jgi:hypothetical protein